MAAGTDKNDVCGDVLNMFLLLLFGVDLASLTYIENGSGPTKWFALNSQPHNCEIEGTFTTCKIDS